MTWAALAYAAGAFALTVWALERVADAVAELLEFRTYRRSYPRGLSWAEWRRRQ